MIFTKRVSLALVVAASFGSFLSRPSWAQPNLVRGPVRVSLNAPPLIQIESIDANAKTVTLREVKFGPDGKGTPGDAFTLPVTATTKRVAFESSLPASQLKVDDVVTLLGQRAPAGALKLSTFDADGNAKPFQPPMARGYARSGYQAEEFTVIAVSPDLMLRRGGIPVAKEPNEGFVRLSFSNGGDKNLGILSLAPAADGVGTVTTLLLTATDNLEFDRKAPLELAALAEARAAGKMSVQADMSTAPDGTRSLSGLTATAIK